MKVLGLIVEYNPFHHGHLYHLQQSIKKTRADVVIAVMSGPFLQRGEPAIVDKWSRTRMALQGGVDLVIELPTIYATQKAELFADGAVSILQDLSVTDICFGSENGEIEPFKQAVEWFNHNEGKLNDRIQLHLKQGKSYPRAFSEAYQSLSATDQLLDLSQPNNILGFHYVQSAMKRGSIINVHTITRTGSGYHDQTLSDTSIASATAIRGTMLNEDKGIEDVSAYIPSYTKDELANYYSAKGSFHSWESYFPFLQYKLMSISSEELNKIYECEEGLEHRLKREIVQSHTFEEFIDKLKTKRYTRTRLQRLLTHVYLQSSKSFVRQTLAEKKPPYLRVLGMSNNGRKYLSSIKKDRTIPVISRASESNHPAMEKDVIASQLHGLIHHPTKSTFMDEYKAIPIQFDEEKQVFR
ncbi:hypothetical protein CR194_08665 [Salipaludibacillus keqinensis]|uniref:tRNA(Met) cytidine acetate ligase n=1 Tax=Salipaludibacillus keqinensis TaxID=2045207 RepID=A0A323TDT8_9BACI|nr:nucleotidyltransferase [Salipaludibacillus keqinensis]PYZ93258.1 hypothetical protein CR194_08665 [Salipaludibacillus keqinensis]